MSTSRRTSGAGGGKRNSLAAVKRAADGPAPTVVEVYASQKLPELKLSIRPAPWDEATATHEVMAKPFGGFLLWRRSNSSIMFSYHSRQGGQQGGQVLAVSEAAALAKQRHGSLLVGTSLEANGAKKGKGGGGGSVKHLKIFIATVYHGRRVSHVYKLESRPNRSFDDLAELLAGLPYLNIKKHSQPQLAMRGGGGGGGGGGGKDKPGDAAAPAAAVFPQWLAKRTDFQNAFPRFTEHADDSVDEATLAALKQHRGFRSNDEVALLVRWMKRYTSLDLAKVATLCSVAGHQYLGTQRVLFHKGDRADAFYMVFSGTVCVTLPVGQGGGGGKGQQEKEQVLAELHRGDGFGEHGLDTEAPRLATVRAKANTHLIRIDREHYLTSLLIYHRARRRRLMHWLRHRVSRGLLRHWSPERIFNLADVSSEQTFHRNNVLVSQNDPTGTCLFFVRGGQVQLQKEVLSFQEVRRPMGCGRWEEEQTSCVKVVPVCTLDEGDWFSTGGVRGAAEQEFTAVCQSESADVVMVLAAAFPLFTAEHRRVFAAVGLERQRQVELKQLREGHAQQVRAAVRPHTGPRRAKREAARRAAQRAAAGVAGSARAHSKEQAGRVGCAHVLPDNVIQRQTLKHQLAVTDRDGFVHEWHEKLPDHAVFEGVKVCGRAPTSLATY